MPGTFAYTAATNKTVITAGASDSPADFPSFVAADRAGTLALKAATASATGMTLTTQVRPAELLAIELDFTLAGTSAGAGDTLDIYGVDERKDVLTGAAASGQKVVPCAKTWRFKVGDTVRLIDNDALTSTETSIIASISPGVSITLTDNIVSAYFTTGDIIGINQTESIDVSGGDATYTSTKRYGALAYWDCTGFADGTVAVLQNLWGVIWDNGNGFYRITSNVDWGNVSISTYFATANEFIDFNSNLTIGLTANATLKQGVK